MKPFYEYIYTSLPILMTFFTLGWIYCFRVKIFSWLDVFWGSSFLFMVFFAILRDPSPSKGLIGLMYLIWIIRLTTHLFVRIKKYGEDKRYIKLKKQWKVWYGINFFVLFQIEAILTILNSAPLFLNYPSQINAIQYLSFIMFCLAIAGETISDAQLKKYVSENEKTEVCNIGFWKYSRHPNYFFEWMIWLSFAVFSLSSVEVWPGIIPAIVMYFFLTKITGIPAAEESSLQSKGEKYMLYQKSTNAFFPWIPKLIIAVMISSVSLSTVNKTFAAGAVMTQSEKIKHVFTNLRADNLHILDDFYAKDTEFIDPLGKHKGIESVRSYYKGLYQNVKEIKFDYQDIISNGNTHVLVWKMTLKAQGLNGGNPVIVDGNSYIKFNQQDLVIYHRDYFDMGEFIYEHIPILGWTIQKVKNRLRGDK